MNGPRGKSGLEEKGPGQKEPIDTLCPGTHKTLELPLLTAVSRGMPCSAFSQLIVTMLQITIHTTHPHALLYLCVSPSSSPDVYATQSTQQDLILVS